MKEYIEIQGDILKKLIKRTYKSQDNVADEIGVSRTTLNNHIKKNRITPDLLEKIEFLAKVSYKEIESGLQNDNQNVNFVSIIFSEEEIKNILLENERLHKKLEDIFEQRLNKSEEINDLYRENKKLEKELEEIKKGSKK